jgi:hypothetical protein
VGGRWVHLEKFRYSKEEVSMQFRIFIAQMDT